MMRRLLRFAVLVGAVLALAAGAHAGPTPVTGGVFTSVNVANDGPGHCFNDGGTVNCNIYDGKQYVWFNGGPSANSLSPRTGVFSITVLSPGGQPNPNDGAPKNLSDDYDCWQNRTVSLVDGEASSYPGAGVVIPPGCYPGGVPISHLFTQPLYRLYPYADTTNNGGVYIMATCYRGPAGGPFANTVDPRNCKYDAFKVRPPPDAPPYCQLFQVIEGPPKQIQILAQDPTTGIEDITVDLAVNATVDVPAFFVGDVDPILVTATKLDQTQSAQVAITVRTVAGFTLSCDPVLKPKRVGKFGAKYLARQAKANRLRTGR
jgi:hypothetical protein